MIGSKSFSINESIVNNIDGLSSTDYWTSIDNNIDNTDFVNIIGSLRPANWNVFFLSSPFWIVRFQVFLKIIFKNYE